MTKRTRNEIYLLVGLLILLGATAYRSLRSGTTFVSFQSTDGNFKPLDVPDPALRLDLLKGIRKLKYSGQHRNIFSAQPLPPPPASRLKPKVVPPVSTTPAPAGPPPLVVPATFFGIVTDVATGKRSACFSAPNDDVFILPVGGMLLNQFRVVEIGGNSVELQEISTDRETTLTLAPPLDGSETTSPPGMPRL